MFEREFCVRLRENVIVPVSERRGGDCRKYFAGDWLFGCFVKVDNGCFFRSEKIFLSLSCFDRIKFSAFEGKGLMREELEELLDFIFDGDQGECDDPGEDEQFGRVFTKRNDQGFDRGGDE